jgi:hypothetical protein
MSVIEEYARCLELWRAAATEEIVVSGMSRSEALSLRSRLYRIRAAMEQQRHPYYENVARAKISIMQLDTGAGGGDLWALSIVPVNLRSAADR